MSVSQICCIINKETKEYITDFTYGCGGTLTEIGSMMYDVDEERLKQLRKIPNMDISTDVDGESYIIEWKPTLVEFFNDLKESYVDKMEHYKILRLSETESFYTKQLDCLSDYDFDNFCGFKSKEPIEIMTFVSALISPYCRYQWNEDNVWHDKYEVTVKVY